MINLRGMFDDGQDICTVSECLPPDRLPVARGEIITLDEENKTS